MRALLTLALLFAGGLVAQSLEGTITNSASQVPVQGATVELTQGDKSAGHATTDSAGQFRIESLPPGAYKAEVHKSGFLIWRQAQLMVTASAARLDVGLVPLSTVSGRVTTPDGKPVADAGVLLFVPGFFDGLSATTKEDGRFTMGSVHPEAYDLSARAPAGMAAPDADDGSHRAWIRTSQRIMVPPGVNLDGQDIILRTAPAHRLSGRILGPTGDPAAGASISIVPASELPLGKLDITTKAAEDGSFEFPALYDASWRLEVDFQAEDAKLSATRYLRMAGVDIDRFNIVVRRPFSLSGVLAGVRPQSRVGLLLVPEGGGDRIAQAKIDDAGGFRFEGITEGRFYFAVMPVPPTLYLASIRVGEREVLGETFDLSGPLPVTVTLNADGGTVRGSVEDCGGATVVVVPREVKLQTPQGFVRTAKCQSNGSFEIRSLRPGEYDAYAFQNPPGPMEMGVYSNGSLNASAVHATVRANEATGVSLKVTARQ